MNALSLYVIRGRSEGSFVLELMEASANSAHLGMSSENLFDVANCTPDYAREAHDLGKNQH